LRTPNYYTGIDPEHYYRTSGGIRIPGKSTSATDHKDVYLSDLMNNENCSVSFSAYRDTDNAGAVVKISWTDVKNGIVRSYNPETGLLAVDCVKKRPSRLSTVFKRTNKLRYVAPESMIVSSVSGGCLLRRVVASKGASRSASRSASSPKGASRSASSPKGASRSASSPKGASRSASSPKGVSTPRRGGRMRITRKKRQTGN
jgi:hypothetical protein